MIRTRARVALKDFEPKVKLTKVAKKRNGAQGPTKKGPNKGPDDPLAKYREVLRDIRVRYTECLNQRRHVEFAALQLFDDLNPPRVSNRAQKFTECVRC